MVVLTGSRRQGVLGRHGPEGLLGRGGRGRSSGATGGFAGITKRDFPKPIIAAVNGSALAGGCEIMLSCDLVVAADHASFGIPEAKRGLIAGAGGTHPAAQAPARWPSPSSWP